MTDQSAEPTTKAPARLARNTAEVAPAQELRPAIGFRDYALFRAEESVLADGTNMHEVTAGMLDKMLSATALEDIMNADMGTVYDTQELIGARLDIPVQRLRFAKSSPTYDSPLGVYVQFRAILVEDFEALSLAAGTEITVSSGASLVAGKLRTLEANELFPVRVQVHSAVAGEGTVIKLKWIPGKMA